MTEEEFNRKVREALAELAIPPAESSFYIKSLPISMKSQMGLHGHKCNLLICFDSWHTNAFLRTG